MSNEAFIQYTMGERDATSFDEAELASIISILDAWIARCRVKRIVNPTTRPRRVIAEFDTTRLRILRERAVVAFNNKA